MIWSREVGDGQGGRKLADEVRAVNRGRGRREGYGGGLRSGGELITVGGDYWGEEEKDEGRGRGDR